MDAPGSWAARTGLVLMLMAASAGFISAGGFASLVSFAGVLAGASLIFAGVRMVADDPPAPAGRPVVLAVAAVARCLRLNLALSGLLLASTAASAATMVAAAADSETGPLLCFCAFTLLLLGLSLVNVGVRRRLGEHEQEHYK